METLSGSGQREIDIDIAPDTPVLLDPQITNPEGLPIYGHEILGPKYRSVNDTYGVHGKPSDYPCNRLDAILHHRPAYSEQTHNLSAETHHKMKG